MSPQAWQGTGTPTLPEPYWVPGNRPCHEAHGQGLQDRRPESVMAKQGQIDCQPHKPLQQEPSLLWDMSVLSPPSPEPMAPYSQRCSAE